ncbi:hypothetical protein SAMN04488072_102215 [Lentibacillus halodurans]|uniref:Uncharacterized protein n=1 Tax=Lentibacillus halodurans TaxID=237679 RepID=A0A1I0W4U0_9BACI|nr:hypothetical protein [Lentibacillus halodurans]SFA83692.1 hypothetical protein SAMN04488072_102215 [Lentibacillus halodurans]
MGIFLSTVGFLGFAVFIIVAIVGLIKKSGKAKFNFGIAGGLFILFIIGAVNTDTSEVEQNSSQAQSEQIEESETTQNPEQEKEEEQEYELSKVSDLRQAVNKGMSEDEFQQVIETANLKDTKENAIGNGEKGYILEAEDGFLFVNSNGEEILDVKTFDTKAEVDEHETKMVAAAKEAEKEKAKKEREETAIHLSGQGDTATDEIELKAGWATFTSAHNGRSNFATHLQDEMGNDLDLLVNTIGGYDGTTFAQIPEDDTYYLNVKADGEWDFTIHQTPPAEMEEAPTTFEGTGDDVVFFNIKNGNYKFTFDHTGESNFAVHLNGVSLLVNEIGNYNGSTRQNLQDDGMYLFSITADGDWRIKIE